MKKILLASGCSYTDPTYFSIFHPNIDCNWPKWPELLAKKLDMEPMNLGYSGAGSEFIYSSLLDKILEHKNKIGLVVAGWSRACRSDYAVSNGDTMYLNRNEKWDKYGDNKYFIERHLRYVYSLQQICKSLKIPLKQAQIINSYETARWHKGSEVWPEARDKVLDREKHYEIIYKNPYAKLINDDFIGHLGCPALGGWNMQDFFTDNDYISDEDRHPNAKGHQLIASKFYEHLD